MAKKILVLTSSGRGNSNSTAMAQAFSSAAREAGHLVSSADLFKLSITPCTGCGKCYTAGRPCVFDDDFTALAQQILDADVVVFAAPVYWYTFPAQATLAIDKFVSFLWGGAPIQGRECVLLTCATEDDPDYVFKGIITAYECTAVHLGWTSAGMVLQAGVRNPGDIAGTDALERCAKLAKQL